MKRYGSWVNPGTTLRTDLPGGHSKWEPPDPIPNSEVKLLSADDSVGFPHVKVGHCQALIPNPDLSEIGVFLCMPIGLMGSDLIVCM